MNTASRSARTGAAGARQLVLASSSPYRRELLARLRLPFTWDAPAIDESAQHAEAVTAMVSRLAEAKARAVGSAHRDALVIGSDQLAVNGDIIVGKPGDHSGAIDQLSAASGRTLRFLTAICLFDTARQTAQLEVVTTEVVFRRLSKARITAYVDAERPYDCAGSFKAEGLGIALFERISSDDPTALTGLPLIALVSMLERCGVGVP